MAPSAVLLLPLLVAIVAAETAFYVPKSFYVIDQTGAVSEPVLLLGGRNFLRARRSALSGTASSSSSSSSSSSGGFGQTFSVSSSSTNNGGYPVYQPAHNVPHSHVAYPLAEPSIHNRFSDDSGGVQGIGLSGTGGNGVFSGSSTIVDSDGKVHYSTHTGKF